MTIQKDTTAEELARPAQGEDREAEHARVRASNDHDQKLERRGELSQHNEGYDEAADGGTSQADSGAAIGGTATDE